MMASKAAAAMPLLVKSLLVEVAEMVQGEGALE